MALREADRRLLSALEVATAGVSSALKAAMGVEPAEPIAAAITVLRGPLPAELEALSVTAQDAVPHAGPAQTAPSGSPATVSAGIQAAYINVGEALAAAAALFTTGRLMFVGTACDLAADRMKTYTQVAKSLNALLPQIVAWELREEGLACHCVCPMCGLGACGCIWASLHNIDLASGGPGLADPDERGIPLRSPPRSGSQLAAAGVQQWDRIVGVDGKPVGAPADLLGALRRHAIGEEVRLTVNHDGERQDIIVRHVSDLP